ncbi:universal stress protein [Mariniblastus fucicola]|uniref:Universal stress protein n=1 Tax=Mariniblastus fucicola TaxID=980251 RepID=A0A5B9P5G1_9BACT|nr:universal stress protein [Mariniblastus fucicola]QEG20405.1 Universal stress protein [Mariniblastus fucicola]
MNRFTGKKIVVPWDYEEMSLESLLMALELTDSNDNIEVVHVVEFPKGVQPSAAIELCSEERQQELKEKFNEQLPDGVSGLNFTIISDFDNEHGVEIANFAAAREAGLIVIGSHGRKGLARLILGSVADKVVQHSRCPVLILRD